jgi:DNA-binding MarR family transcriptional regulator
MIVFLDVIRRRPDAVTGPARVSSQSPENNDEGIITMTITGESARRLPLIGQAVGQAQASLTRFLTGILAESGTSYRLWLGLQRLNAMGGRPARADYEADLSYWLQLDGPAAARLAGDLVAAGLATSDSDGDATVTLSAQGRALREAVLARSAEVTGPILATIDRGDLETTVRTLEEITRLARETTTTEGNR